jgi:hypothetical protein
VSAELSRQAGRACAFLDLDMEEKASLGRVCLDAPDRDALPEWARRRLDRGLALARAAGHDV